MLGSCPAMSASVANGRHFNTVARKMRKAASRISPTDCGREGGYSVPSIPTSYPQRGPPDCMTAKQTLAVLLAEGVRRLRGAPMAVEPGAIPELDAELL